MSGEPALGSVRDALARARRRRFVGRAAELELLDAALAADEPPFTVLHVHGPGGVGKSALLRAYADRALAAGATPALVDGRDLEPSPDGFLAGVARALDRTYLRPAPTQERAAEVLGLPFSTYRRHLGRGVERVVALLWERELHGAGG